MSGRQKGFNQAIDDLEKGESAGDGFGSRLKSELQDLEATLNKIKPHVEDLAGRAGVEATKAKKRVEEEVQKNPLAAVGIVGLVFFILGFLFAYKGSRRSD